MLEAETASTPNYIEDQVLTIATLTSQEQRNNFNFEADANFNETIYSAKHGLQDFLLLDPPISITWLPGGSAKTRPVGHRRGRPPGISCEHLGQKPAETLLLPWSHRPKGYRRDRPANNYCSLETDPVSKIFSNIRLHNTSCFKYFPLEARVATG